MRINAGTSGLIIVLAAGLGLSGGPSIAQTVSPTAVLAQGATDNNVLALAAINQALSAIETAKKAALVNDQAAVIRNLRAALKDLQSVDARQLTPERSAKLMAMVNDVSTAIDRMPRIMTASGVEGAKKIQELETKVTKHLQDFMTAPATY